MNREKSPPPSPNSLHILLKQAECPSRWGDLVQSFLLSTTLKAEHQSAHNHPLGATDFPKLANFPVSELAEMLSGCGPDNPLKTLGVAIHMPEVVATLDTSKLVDDPDKLVIVTARAMVRAVTQFGASISKAIAAVDEDLQTYMTDMHASSQHEVRWDVFKATWSYVSNYYRPGQYLVEKNGKWTYSGAFTDKNGKQQTVCENLPVPKSIAIYLGKSN